MLGRRDSETDFDDAAIQERKPGLDTDGRGRRERLLEQPAE